MSKLPILMLLVFMTLIHVSANPFRNPANTPQPTQQNSPKRSAPKSSFWHKTPLIKPVLQIQAKMISTLTSRFRNYKENITFANVTGVLMISFLYGLIHSLGPGHAKMLFASHTIANPVSVKTMWSSGSLFALTHSGTSLLLFFLFKIIFQNADSNIESVSGRLLQISGIMILLIGTLMLIVPVLEKNLKGLFSFKLKKAASLPVLSIAAGIVPCPGALLILIFSNLLGVLYIGVAAVLFVSAGMLVTVSSIGTITTKFAQLKSSAQNQWVLITFGCIRIAGCLAIMFIGFTMIVSL